MGFHINPQRFRYYAQQNIEEENETSDIKFYINAGINTYKVAQLFQEKCEHLNMNYYFKVVNPDRDEHNRPDKLCIYSSFEHAEIFLKIIQEIKKENPYIIFQTPPILTGRIDKYIGIGMDHIDGKEMGSYNQKLSALCANAAIRVFKGIPSEKIPDIINRQPEILYKLRDEIKRLAMDLGIDENKICVRPEVKQKIEMQNSQLSNNEETISVNSSNIVYTEGSNKKNEVQEQSLKDFVQRFVESYKQVETDAQYNKRIAREESDIELVVEYFEQLKKGKIPNVFFADIQPEEMNKDEKIDFSQDNIDKMFRLLNAANNITVGSQRYDKDFCLSPEIKELIEQMQQSPKVQEMMKVAEIEIKQGKPSKASLREKTPMEKQKTYAREELKKIKQETHYSEEDIINIMFGNSNIDSEYDSKKTLALARICYLQRGIKTKPQKIGEKYKLEVMEKTKTTNRGLFQTFQNTRIRQGEVNNSYQILQQTKQNQEQQQNNNSNNRII